MSSQNQIVRFGPIAFQLLFAGVMLAVIALCPPSRGAILIVSLKGENAGEIARWAVEHEARLLQHGPWAQSIVVVGSRAALLSAAVAHRGLLISGLAVGCGSKAI